MLNEIGGAESKLMAGMLKKLAAIPVDVA